MTHPTFLFGTAWKEDETQDCVERALAAGFRGIDTANQRKHYHEAAVGAALRKVLGEGRLTRADLFLQTKFTSRGGQDQRLPYDPSARVGEQVRQSMESSLEHLGTPQLDSYVLHGPTLSRGLADEDWEAWHAMEALHGEGKTRALGVSNVNLEQLRLLHQGAKVPPTFVQNRCYARRGWDREVRAFCREQGMVYQGFSLLTANGEIFTHPRFEEIARRLTCTPAQLVFRFALGVGMLPLTGTTDTVHMREDLAAPKVELSAADSRTVEEIAG